MRGSMPQSHACIRLRSVQVVLLSYPRIPLTLNLPLYHLLNTLYPHLVAQGGDWGFLVVRNIAKNYPDHCKAHHVNTIFAASPQWTAENPEPEYSEREKRHMLQKQRWDPVGSGEGR